jgi:hypothetical protein
VSAADRERLAAVVADRNSPQKHVWRARIILATAEGGTSGIMRRARKPGLPPLPPALVECVVALTLADPLGKATH